MRLSHQSKAGRRRDADCRGRGDPDEPHAPGVARTRQPGREPVARHAALSRNLPARPRGGDENGSDEGLRTDRGSVRSSVEYLFKERHLCGDPRFKGDCDRAQLSDRRASACRRADSIVVADSSAVWRRSALTWVGAHVRGAAAAAARHRGVRVDPDRHVDAAVSTSSGGRCPPRSSPRSSR